MTDNEIIKALELCFAPDGMACSKCPYHKFGKLCKVERSKDSLDLIKRQKAEIERLEYSIISQDEEKLSYVATLIKEEQERIRLEQIRRLEAENSELQRKNAELQHEKVKLKNEAIKEFAERLCEGRVSNDPVVIAVKVELEEMTEDKGK